MLSPEEARDASSAAIRELKDLMVKDPNVRRVVLGYFEARIDSLRVRIGTCAKDELETTQAQIQELATLHGYLTR